MTSTARRLLAVATLATAAACGRDATAPADRALVPARPAALLGPDEGTRILSDTIDAAGNEIMVAEYAAGTYTLPNGEGGSVASVVIRTVFPGSIPADASNWCITSSIVRVETTAGWSSSVKKSGGCNKEIAVQFERSSPRQRADFSFLMVPGKTRIDFGAVR